MRPGASGSPGIASSSPVKNRPSLSLRYTGSVLRPTDAARPVSCGSRRLPAGRISPPFFTSLPTKRIHSCFSGTFLNVTESPSTAANSCITIASAPCGIGAPVKIRAAVPGSSGLPTAPAMIFCATLNFFPEKHRARRTA